MPDAKSSATGGIPLPGSTLPAPSTGTGMNWPGGLQSGSRFADFWALMGCNAIVFITSVCLMALELTASRLIASYLGSSLYTWTSVIGIVLAGISVGNYVGGWLADRYAPQKLLGWLFLAAGLLTLSTLFLSNWAASTPRPESLEWQWWVMLVVAWVFLLPALSLGMISPVVASIALKRSVRTGMTVGNIYAWGALGSIVGTFLTGFWMIGALGTKNIIWITASALVTMAVLVSGAQRAFRMAVLFGALQFVLLVGVCASTTEHQTGSVCRRIAGIRSFWSTDGEYFLRDDAELQEATKRDDPSAIASIRERQMWRAVRRSAEDGWAEWGQKLGAQLHQLGLHLKLRSDDPNEYNDESDYYAINIYENRNDGDQVKQLRLDYLVHSYYSEENPTKLYYDYEKVYGAVTERVASLWNRQTETTVDHPPRDDFAAALPAGVKYDPDNRRLSIQGGMTYAQLRALLKIGVNGEFGEAVVSAWEEADREGTQGTRTGGVVLSTLEKLPDGIKIPDKLSERLQFDDGTKSLICTGPFGLEQAFALLAQGDDADWARAVIDLFRRSRRTSAMFVGGGGFVFPRWIESRFPFEPLIDVAEIDPAVKLAVEREMGLPTEFGSPAEGKTYVRTHIGDARKFVDERIRENQRRRVANQAPVTYDFVYGDAFNDLSVPWHLTTMQFSTMIRDLLTPGEGAYLVNIIDIYPRAEYPPRKERVGKGTVDFDGLMPARLLPDDVSEERFVAVRGNYAKFEIKKTKTGHQLQYTDVMSKELRDELQNFDVGKGRSSKTSFSAAVADLYNATRERKVIKGAPPQKLFPAGLEGFGWKSAIGDEFANLQIDYVDDGYILSLRGVMDDETRTKLIALAPGNKPFEEALLGLQKQSQAEVVGQFLGRYVKTAQAVFDYVYVFHSSDSPDPGDSRDTFVVACAMKKLDFEKLRTAGGHWGTGPFAWSERGTDGKPVLDGEMEAILQLARDKVLDDDFAPVDNLLAPVFVRRSGDD